MPFHHFVVPLPPASGGRQGFGLIAPLLHVFLAHPHLGGGWRAERDGRGISTMVKDGGCPFMFDGALSFDRVLMPAHFFPMAVVWPSATPAVLSFMKRIFTVAKMILISSTRLGLAIYMRSIRSLS